MSTVPGRDLTDPPPGGPMPVPAAVLWDMDGTLVDTESYWIDAEHAMAQRHGASWSQDHAMALVGSGLLDSGRYIRQHMGLDLSPEEIVEVLLDDVVARIRDEVPWRPGARDLLASLAEVQVPQALVTMSYRRFVEPVLAALPPGIFDAVVTGDEVARGKPHPDPYLAGLVALGDPDPRRTLALEDSPTGAASARAAGVVVVAVPCHVEVPRELYDATLDSLTDTSPHHLATLLD